MKRLCYGVFLVSTLLFGFGVWVYETKDWSNYPVFFSLGSALLLCMAVFLFWVGRKKGHRVILLTGCLSSLFWLLSTIPLIQKTGWSGSSRQDLIFKVLDTKTGRPIPGALVRIASKFEKYGESKTDVDGKAKIEASLPASGNFSLYHRQGGVHLLGLKVQVEMNDYQPPSFDFDENNGWWPLYGPPIPEIEIRLNKK
jgi:hypothetical protein